MRNRKVMLIGLGFILGTCLTVIIIKGKQSIKKHKFLMTNVRK